ncbi:agmatine deiminase family protein [Psychroserpens sp.]|uniref:agmatine deiminase family protein n=1 Tax=Psychroserpens sp. TaxID=2020870 RepID=UPI001B1F8C78|nr:agmatine deiminase family protein [Psychroserpens sp.]MBO6606612.1 agmatine deiminase family protein [Psychroserpens sp.]MBO6653316.1 agmatine deiminase family protein [Psychroserpens sp.]MBO6680657.1 agmatine deiminase family protein [Psychroserpens sp.]MBO6750385.1 agmatine deiminase family protein [Psychroserpens sp.]MBO6914867.1 agmatine deiminase family protein [Psychroserpens sp.]
MTLIKQRLILIVLFLTFFNLTFAQEETPLPKGLTESEKSLVSQFQFRSALVTEAPSVPVRAAAEWEEVEYLVVRWTPSYQNILRQIVQVGVNECKVIIATQDQSGVASYLLSNGVSLTNVSFLNVPSNTIWIRDYAGNTVYSNDVGERALVDWIYNRPRPFDDAMPVSHASMLSLPIYETISGTNDLVNTGGNYMSDGLGNAFASELILEENEVGNPYGVTSKTEAQIDNIMFNYMGITNYVKMPTLPYDGIHHIDMHMKLLDEETLLVSKYPNGVADGPQIEANIQYVLNNFQSPFGTPYKVEWIDAPPSTSGLYPDNGGYYRTYSNSIIINKSILVPTYRPEVDGAALAKYQELMPGYNVVGIDVDNFGENLISSSGAIHCITHTIGVADPLWIVHQPVEFVNTGTTLTIDAMIKHVSGITAAKVFWREEGTTTFNEAAMSYVSGDDWTVDLPLAASATNIDYYIEAEANSGKQLTRPLVAPSGFWTTTAQTLSVEEWADNNISAPYPNPTRDKVSFNLKHIQDPLTVSIYNNLGQKLFSESVNSGQGVLELTLNKHWNGVLYVVFDGSFGSVNRKIIKI